MHSRENSYDQTINCHTNIYMYISFTFCLMIPIFNGIQLVEFFVSFIELNMSTNFLVTKQLEKVRCSGRYRLVHI